MRFVVASVNSSAGIAALHVSADGVSPPLLFPSLTTSRPPSMTALNFCTKRVRRFAQLNEVNFVVCCFLTLLCVYITALAVFHRSILHPLKNAEVNRTSTDGSDADAVDYSYSGMSLIVLWIFAILVGKLFAFAKLPDLLGVLLCGVAFRNIPVIREWLFIEDGLNSLLRTAALAIILVRGGIGLDATVLLNKKIVILLFGMLSSIAEATVVGFVAWLLFQMTGMVSAIFGAILAATSPAVTIPTMVALQESGIGVTSGVPTTVLASAAIDNVVCITLTSVLELLLNSGTAVWVEILLTIVQIIAGILVGFAAGFILWYFPTGTTAQLHFARGCMLECASFAFIFGGDAIGWRPAAVLAIVISSVVSSTRWKADNPFKDSKESNSFALQWNFVGMPFMFALIGYAFDVRSLQLEVVGKSFAVIAIAVITRIVAVLLFSLASEFTKHERLFLSISFLPKATVQAALAPHLITLCNDASCGPSSIIVMQCCVLAILATAPIGQFVLQRLGPYALKEKRSSEVIYSSSEITPRTIHIPVRCTSPA